MAAVGPGADPGLVGRRVVSSLNGSGGYAELAVADAKGLFEVPDGLPLDEAVALLADGRTATLMTVTPVRVAVVTADQVEPEVLTELATHHRREVGGPA